MAHNIPNAISYYFLIYILTGSKQCNNRKDVIIDKAFFTYLLFLVKRFKAIDQIGAKTPRVLP